MKLNVIFPWVLVLGLSACLGAVYVKSNAKESELQKLRPEVATIEQLKADLAEAQQKAQIPTDQVLISTKDKEELIRLRGEVGKLKQDYQKVSKDLASAQSSADAAKTAAANATRDAEAARARLTATATAAAQHNDPKRDACINNLRQLDGAKQQWALEMNKTAEAVPTAQDIATYLKDNAIPACPSGGTYTLNAISSAPTCSIPGHSLEQ